MQLLEGGWPHLPALTRIGLALVIGLFVGIERERSGKEAGLRTFTFASLLGCVGGMLDDRFALLAMLLLGVLVAILGFETIRTGEGAEITTAAALLVIGFAGVLVGRGHRFTPTVLGVATAGLLAWKKPLAGFSRALTPGEFRSAVQLAILAFVVYPALPEGAVDPWGLVDAREAWLTVILIASVGFANYVLLNLYGARGVELTGFLGGLVNSTVTVSELASRVRDDAPAFRSMALKGTALATAAMLLRNGLLLAALSSATFRLCALPIALMTAGTAVARLFHGGATHPAGGAGASASEPPSLSRLASPFSPFAALRLGALFLAIRIAGSLAQDRLGELGFYFVSLVGGLFSSSSAVAAAAAFATSTEGATRVAALGALLACAVSALVNLPLVWRLGRDRWLTTRVAWTLAAVVAGGGVGAVLQF